MFRVEAKIPGRVLIADEQVKLFAPYAIQKAICEPNKNKIEKLANLNIDLFTLVEKEDNAFDLISKKITITQDDLDIFKFLLNQAQIQMEFNDYESLLSKLRENIAIIDKPELSSLLPITINNTHKNLSFFHTQQVSSHFFNKPKTIELQNTQPKLMQ